MLRSTLPSVHSEIDWIQSELGLQGSLWGAAIPWQKSGETGSGTVSCGVWNDITNAKRFAIFASQAQFMDPPSTLIALRGDMWH